MNFSRAKLIAFGFFLSLTLMGAEVFEDEDTGVIFSAFKVGGGAAVSSCSQLSENVYVTFSHMLDNQQLWDDFNSRKERLKQTPAMTQLHGSQKNNGLLPSCLILTFNQQKTIILEQNENRYRGKKVIGIHTINKIPSNNAEKYTLLAFTESAEKLSLTLPEFHHFSNKLDFSGVVDWKISFALPQNYQRLEISQVIYPLQNTSMHANSFSRSLYMHRTPILQSMAGGLIWNQNNQLVGILVATLPCWKEHHSFDEQNVALLRQMSGRFKFGFTESKEHAGSFDITLNEVAVGQLISAQEITQAFSEYLATAH